MKDIVGKLEKRVRLVFRLIVMGYLICSNSLDLSGWKGVFFMMGLIFMLLVIEHTIGYIIRTIYKIEPLSIAKNLHLAGIKGFQNEMKTYQYSEDYDRSISYLPSESDSYEEYRKNYYHRSFIHRYKFNYITLFDSSKKNKDKIEVYKLIDPLDMRHMIMSINLELVYINNSFVIKNLYSPEALLSLNADEAFAHFNKCIDFIKVLFNDDDFETLMNRSFFELKLSYGFERNLIKSNTIYSSRNYNLNVIWCNELESMNLGIYKDCFRGDHFYIDGGIFTYIDNTVEYQQYPDRHSYIKEKYYMSPLFGRIFTIYEQKTKKSLDSDKYEDMLLWKNKIIKRKNKL